MPGIALSSLRVTADMDASAYTQGMQAKVQADQAGIASGEALGQSLARVDAALDSVAPGTARLSKGLIEGYGSAANFERQVRAIGDAIDRGMGIDRANLLLDLAYRKFGLVADSAVLAKQGYVSLVPAIDALNKHYSIQAELIDRTTQATQRQSAAMAAQAEYNDRLGVKDPQSGSGTAKASMDAFMAPYGGLAGIAAAKGQEAGKAFTDAFNDSLRIGAPSATSQGATFSALDEMMQKQEMIEKARADQNARTAQQGIGDAFGIGAAPGRSAKDSMAFFDETLKAQEALDAAAKKLQASLNPLAAAQDLYNKSLATYKELAASGRISSEELAAGNDMAAKQLAATTKETANFSGAAAFGGTQFMAFTAAIRHMFDAVQAGRPITQAFMMELGNLQYGLSGSDGLGGSLQNIAKYALSFVSPLSVATTVVGGFGVAATVAAVKWQNAQTDIARSLIGVGRATGATVDDINKLSEANSSASTLSISEARNVAMALAQTGNVTKEELTPITALTKDLAASLGVSVPEATKVLAGAFKDGAGSGEELLKRFGALNDKNRDLLQSLTASGDRIGANKVIIDGLKSSLGEATELTEGWAKAWSIVSNSVSIFFTKLGEGVSKSLSGGSLDQQIAAMEERLEGTQKKLQGASSSGASLFDPFSGTGVIDDTKTLTAEISKLTEALDKLKTKRDQINSQAKTGQETQDRNKASLAVGSILSQVTPAPAQQRALESQLKALIDIRDKALSDPAVAKSVTDWNELGLAIGRVQGALGSVIDPQKKVTEQMQIQLQAVDARAPADRRAQAEAAKRLEQSAQDIKDEERLQQIKLAGATAAGGQTAADQQIVTRIGLLGTLATVQDKVNAKRLELVNANRELDPANKLTASDIASITHITQVQEEQTLLQERVSVGVAKEAEIRKKMADDAAAFISRQRTIPITQDDRNSFLTTQEKKIEKLIDQSNIASSKLEGLKKLEQDSGGSAAGFRNLVDSTAVSNINSLASSLADITTRSKTAGQAFASLGQTVVRALEEMLIKLIVVVPLAKALDNSLGGFFGGGGGGGGGIPRPDLTGGFHSGGMMSEPSFLRFVPPGTFDLAPRYHSGIGPDETAAILHKTEGVFTRKQMANLAPVGAAGGGGGNRVAVNIVNNASGTEVKATKQRRGGVDVHSVVISAVGEGMAKGTFDAAMQARFGSKIRPIPR